MKELSRFEMAAVKRTAQNVKTMRRKLEKLYEKQSEITTEINQLEELVYEWEQPIIKMTGGFTSEQVLNGEMNVINEEIPEDSTVDDSPLDEFQIQKAQFEESFDDSITDSNLLNNGFPY